MFFDIGAEKGLLFTGTEDQAKQVSTLTPGGLFLYRSPFDCS